MGSDLHMLQRDIAQDNYLPACQLVRRCDKVICDLLEYTEGGALPSRDEVNRLRKDIAAFFERTTIR